MSKYLDNKKKEEEIARQMKKIKGLNTLMIIIVLCLIILFVLVYVSKFFL